MTEHVLAPIRSVKQMSVPMHLVQPLNFADNELSSQLYKSFLARQRTLTVPGSVLANTYQDPMNVALLLPNYNETEDTNIDPVTAFIKDFLITFGMVNLPEQLGTMHLLYRLIRVRIRARGLAFIDKDTVANQSYSRDAHRDTVQYAAFTFAETLRTPSMDWISCLVRWVLSLLSS